VKKRGKNGIVGVGAVLKLKRRQKKGNGEGLIKNNYTKGL